MNTQLLQQSTEAVQAALGDLHPRVSMVLGSGWSAWLSQLEPMFTLPYESIPVMGKATVPGHAGRLSVVDISGLRVLCFQGRRHFYEGTGWEPVVFPAFLSKQLNISAILLTCAAGAINTRFHPGDLVVIDDHLNFMGSHPLIGTHDPLLGPRFPDMSEIYHPRLKELFSRAAREAGQPVNHGVYAAVSGPAYETPAEVRALGHAGADLVGMSTVPEATLARSMGLPVFAVAAVTNMAAGLTTEQLNHAAVLNAMSDNAVRILPLFSSFLGMLRTSFIPEP